MKTLKNYPEKEIVRLIQEHWIDEDDLVESGICPVCFNQEHNNVLYGKDMILYEDDDFVCFFEDEPRAEGHVVIYSRKHYSDLSDMDFSVGQKIFSFTQKMISLLKEVYHAESVYLCSINDGEVSHFQLQLIPRYHNEKTGTYNFIKHRRPYVEDSEKEKKLHILLSRDFS